MLLSILLIAILSATFATEHNVPEYSNTDFQDRMEAHEIALVMFYAPWCGHCKKLKPEFARAAKELEKADPPVILVKVDCTEGGKEVCKKHSVSGYPTLKIFRHGNVKMDYEGPRDAPGIIKFMKNKAGPTTKHLASKEEIDAFIEDSADVAVVGIFTKGAYLKSVFSKAAELSDSVKFGYCDDQSVIEEAGIPHGITLYRPKHLRSKFEENEYIYEDDGDETKLTDFINSNYHGLVGQRNSLNKEDFKTPLVIAYYAVDYEKNAKGTNYWRNRILKAAVGYKDKFTFAISAKADFEDELSEFGIDEDADAKKPIVVAKDANNEKYVMEAEFSVEAFEEFLSNLAEGQLDPFVKSEPIPKDNPGPVKIVVARNFDEMVINNDKDTMIEFYAPWCSHCKKLAPIYEELAQKLEGEVDFLKMDATANEVPSKFGTKGYPTLYWVPKNAKEEPIKYEGERDLKDLLLYVAKHATEELANYDRNGKPSSKTDKTEL